MSSSTVVPWFCEKGSAEARRRPTDDGLDHHHRWLHARAPSRAHVAHSSRDCKSTFEVDRRWEVRGLARLASHPWLPLVLRVAVYKRTFRVAGDLNAEDFVPERAPRLRSACLQVWDVDRDTPVLNLGLPSSSYTEFNWIQFESKITAVWSPCGRYVAAFWSDVPEWQFPLLIFDLEHATAAAAAAVAAAAETEAQRYGPPDLPMRFARWTIRVNDLLTMHPRTARPRPIQNATRRIHFVWNPREPLQFACGSQLADLHIVALRPRGTLGADGDAVDNDDNKGYVAWQLEHASRRCTHTALDDAELDVTNLNLLGLAACARESWFVALLNVTHHVVLLDWNAEAPRWYHRGFLSEPDGAERTLAAWREARTRKRLRAYNELEARTPPEAKRGLLVARHASLAVIESTIVVAVVEAAMDEEDAARGTKRASIHALWVPPASDVPLAETTTPPWGTRFAPLCLRRVLRGPLGAACETLNALFSVPSDDDDAERTTRMFSSRLCLVSPPARVELCPESNAKALVVRVRPEDVVTCVEERPVFIDGIRMYTVKTFRRDASVHCFALRGDDDDGDDNEKNARHTGAFVRLAVVESTVETLESIARATLTTDMSWGIVWQHCGHHSDDDDDDVRTSWPRMKIVTNEDLYDWHG